MRDIYSYINELEAEINQYRTLGTVEEIRGKMEELGRWHSDRLNSRIKNEFSSMSTLVCHNCDHKDEYIEELEAEIEEYRAIGTVEEIQERLERLQKWHDEHLEDITVDLAEYRDLCKVEEVAHMKSLKRIIQRNGTLGKALEEGAEYEAIGTVEECRAAVEKVKQEGKNPVGELMELRNKTYPCKQAEMKVAEPQALPELNRGNSP